MFSYKFFKRLSILLVILYLILGVFFVAQSMAKEVEATWEPNPTEENVVGYTLWYGPECHPTNVTHPSQIDPAVWDYAYRVTVDEPGAVINIPPGDYCFSLTAFNEQKVSDYSARAMHTVPADAYVPPEDQEPVVEEIEVSPPSKATITIKVVVE